MSVFAYESVEGRMSGDCRKGWVRVTRTLKASLIASNPWTGNVYDTSRLTSDTEVIRAPAAESLNTLASWSNKSRFFGCVVVTHHVCSTLTVAAGLSAMSVGSCLSLSLSLSPSLPLSAFLRPLPYTFNTHVNVCMYVRMYVCTHTYGERERRERA